MLLYVDQQKKSNPHKLGTVESQKFLKTKGTAVQQANKLLTHYTYSQIDTFLNGWKGRIDTFTPRQEVGHGDS